jgi:membrane-associated phospholipid phosphatase
MGSWLDKKGRAVRLLSLLLCVLPIFSTKPAPGAEGDLPGREPLRPIAVRAEKEPAASPKPNPGGGGLSDFIEFFPRHLLKGARESFSLKNLVILALAGAETGALLTADDDIREYFREERPIGRTAEDAGTTLGSPEVLFGLAGATFLLGEITKSPRIRAQGETALESLAIVGTVTALLKVTTQRERPDGSNSLSFPSLHAAGSFAAAASLYETYGLRVSIPAFLTATFTSVARVQEDKHFLSDTIFGGVLGTIVGLAVGKLHKAKNGWGVLVVPHVKGDEYGMRLSFRF